MFIIWCASCPGCVKINVDASWDATTSKVGLGCIVQDEDALVMGGMTMRTPNCFYLNLVEVGANVRLNSVDSSKIFFQLIELIILILSS